MKKETRKSGEVSSGSVGKLQFTPSKWPQIYAALAANFGSGALGSVLAFTATFLPDLRESGDLGTLTPGQEAWIGSIMTLGAVFSCPFYGFAIQAWGRRTSMLATTLPFVSGWLLMGFAQNLWMILLGRFVTGFCAGGFSITAPVYITETADHKIRGALASGFDMMLTVGILYIFLIGTFANWRIQAFACGILPVITHLLMTFAPESPQFLIEKGRQAEASRALCWLRGSSSSQDVEEELKKMTEAVDESKAVDFRWQELLTKPILYPISIGLALMFFQQASAIDGVMMYTVDIFQSAGSNINENLSTNIVGAIQVVTTISAMGIVDRCGRRFLLLISALFMVISLGTMGLYFHLKKSGASDGLGWLPLTSLLVYVVAFSIGFGPVPWLMMGELLPNRVKGLGSGIITISRWILAFGVTLIFKDIMRGLGEDVGYWLFAGFCGLGLIYTWTWVPETKGRTLQEIHDSFASHPIQTASNSTKDQPKNESNQFEIQYNSNV